MQNLSLPVKSIICVALIMFAGFASGLSTTDSIVGWYSGLNKPWFNPPNWIFGPAWTLLYVLIGLSIARVWHYGKGQKYFGSVIAVFIIQMVLNLIWSPTFFNLHLMATALMIILLLWVFIIIYIFRSRKIDKLASLFFIPYLLWVSFATALNASILYLN